MTNVFIGLGSNIDPEENLKAAARILRGAFPGIRFSSVYRTKARDVEDQPDFLNAVAVFESEESPEDIHKKLQEIEQTLKKQPLFPKGPRTIDLDFLLYGDECVEKPSLTIPHPRTHERRFVLEPLIELMNAHDQHPAMKKSWQELLQKTLTQESKRIVLEL